MTRRKYYIPGQGEFRAITPGKPTGAMRKLSSRKINNAHKGRLIFIYGNGMSLWCAPYYRWELANYVSIGIYVSYWMLPSTYLLWADVGRLQIPSHEELINLDCPVFCSKCESVPFYNHFTQLEDRTSGHLSKNYAKGLYNAGNSTFLAINLAYIMGAAEIALIGVDYDSTRHFYTDVPIFVDRPFYKEQHTDYLERHGCDKPYISGDSILANMEPVADYLREKDVKVWNCSPHSRLGCFENIELGELIEMRRDPKWKRK